MKPNKDLKAWVICFSNCLEIKAFWSQPLLETYEPRLASHPSPGSLQRSESSAHFLGSSPFEQSVPQCRSEELIRRKSLGYPGTEKGRKVSCGKMRQGEGRETIQERWVVKDNFSSPSLCPYLSTVVDSTSCPPAFSATSYSVMVIETNFFAFKFTMINEENLTLCWQSKGEFLTCLHTWSLTWRFVS